MILVTTNKNTIVFLLCIVAISNKNFVLSIFISRLRLPTFVLRLCKSKLYSNTLVFLVK